MNQPKQIPACLSYLTIYNPTLRPADNVAPDDEDAEEQAHIVFYTARERAVSRDKMLRQVGLAKALVNFAGAFGQEEPCSIVRSQARRMVSIEPEPDFWMHACVELAKSPRPPAPEKKKAPEKGKAPAAQESSKHENTETVYDYNDSSINDAALRSHLQRGYDEFKVTYGSFTSILSISGHRALELQLERFFTVWAWKWAPEEGFDFGEHMGMQLHPLHARCIPALDELSEHLPERYASCILVASPSTTPSMSTVAVIPSTRYTTAAYPPALLLRLSQLVAVPAPRPSGLRKRSSKYVSLQNALTDGTKREGKAKETRTERGTFMGSMHVAMPSLDTMDMRKWAWPGYLTFGKGQGKERETKVGEDGEKAAAASDAGTGEGLDVDHSAAPKPEAGKGGAGNDRVEVQVDVDRASLREAVGHGEAPGSTPTSPTTPATPATVRGPKVPPIPEDSGDSVGQSEVSAASGEDERRPLDEESHVAVQMDVKDSPPRAGLEPPTRVLSTSEDAESSATPLTFAHMPAFFWSANDTLLTRRRKVPLSKRDNFLLFLASRDGDELSEDELHAIASHAHPVLDAITDIIMQHQESDSAIYTSIDKVLQDEECYLIQSSDEQTVLASPGYSSTSDNLFNAQELLYRPFTKPILEVFSRGQAPQHWHIAQRGVAIEMSGKGDVYLEVKRKEASLPDVDNKLASLMKQHLV